MILSYRTNGEIEKARAHGTRFFPRARRGIRNRYPLTTLPVCPSLVLVSGERLRPALLDPVGDLLERVFVAVVEGREFTRIGEANTPQA